MWHLEPRLARPLGRSLPSAAALFVTPTLSAQIELQKLEGSLDDAYDAFGQEIAIDGDMMIVGGIGGGFGGGDPGRAYIYRRIGGCWVEEAVLARTSGGKGQHYGRTVGISGDVAMVGVPYENGTGYEGAVYVYERIAGVWTEVGKLTSPSREPDNFGWALALQGDVVVVGDPQDDSGPGIDPGAAFVFEKPAGGWTSTSSATKLSASDAAAGDDFGSAVAIDGDTIVVGAYPNRVNSTSLDGSAYVFERSTTSWSSATQVAILTNAETGGYLGFSVAIDNDRVLLGAPHTSSVAPVKGAAFLYEKPAGGWTDMSAETLRFDTSDAGSAVLLGQDVAIEGDWIVLGAPGSQAVGDSGCADAYHYDAVTGAWNLVWKSDGSDSDDFANYDSFGGSVTLAWPYVVVGAPDDDSRGMTNAGAAYLFVLDPPSATFSSYGSGPLLLTGSLPGPEDNDIAMTVTGAPPSTPVGWLLVGTVPDFAGAPHGSLTLWIDLSAPYFLLPLGSYDASGSIAISGSIGYDVPVGTHFFFQAFAFGPGLKLHSQAIDLTVVP
jgi:hypothetical protein